MQVGLGCDFSDVILFHSFFEPISGVYRIANVLY